MDFGLSAQGCKMASGQSVHGCWMDSMVSLLITVDIGLCDSFWLVCLKLFFTRLYYGFVGSLIKIVGWILVILLIIVVTRL